VATILIIEDEEPTRLLLCAALEAAGHEVREASNARLGLELYRERSVDLVITDILMPEMNRLDMVLELASSFLDVKVIAMSEDLESGSKRNVAKLLGARQTFHKPLDVEKLLSAVRYDLAH